MKMVLVLAVVCMERYLCNIYNQSVSLTLSYRGWAQFIFSLQGLLLSLDTHLTYVPENMQLINHKNGAVPWSDGTL